MIGQEGGLGLKWLELSVKTPPEFVEPLSQIFYRYGHGGVSVEVEGGYNPDEGETAPTPETVTLKTYLPMNSTAEGRRHQIDVGVRLVAHVGDISPLQEAVLEETEWQDSWKQHFHTLHIGRRIVISPSWRSYDPKRSEIVITIDPGMAFGTGHHPTTKMCLERLEDLVAPGMDVLDAGCGSGILSIAAANLGATSVLGLDVDSVAVRVARQNVRLNRREHIVRVALGSLPHHEVKPRSYDVAVANISALIVSEMAGALTASVKPGGKIVASGILVDNRDKVEQALVSAGTLLVETNVEGDWVTLVASVP